MKDFFCFGKTIKMAFFIDMPQHFCCFLPQINFVRHEMNSVLYY